MNQIGEAEPIFELSHKYAEGTDSPAWKKKQIRHHTLMKLNDIQENNSEDSMSLSDDGESDDLPGMIKDFDDKSTGGDPSMLKKKVQKSKGVQDKLKEKGEKIKF